MIAAAGQDSASLVVVMEGVVAIMAGFLAVMTSSDAMRQGCGCGLLNGLVVGVVV